jgi:hypothetical protein
MIAKFEKMNMRQENYEEVKETKDLLENQKEKELEKYHTMLVQLKEEMDDHRNIGLPEILKKK